MADFGFNTDLTVKPTQTGSSIGDIVNMARGVQAYQKQAATMPYEIQHGRKDGKSARTAHPAGVGPDQCALQ